jgi:uncharacterized DUF497 family protein
MEFSRFDWDGGNRSKCQKHGVSIAAIESLFASPVAVLPDAAHSGDRLDIDRTEGVRGLHVQATRRGPTDPPDQRPLYARQGVAGL